MPFIYQSLLSFSEGMILIFNLNLMWLNSAYYFKSKFTYEFFFLIDVHENFVTKKNF